VATFNVIDYGDANTGKAGWTDDAAMTIGNNHVTSDRDPWTADDVGKPIYVGGLTSAASPIISRAGGTITAFNSAGDITISLNAAYSLTSCYCVWGQDDAAAFIDAQAAASAAGVGNTVSVPNGKYICKSRIWAPGGNYVNLVGEGPLGTWILLPTSNLPAQVDGSGLLVESNRNFIELGGFAVYGPKVCETAMTSTQAFIRVTGTDVHANHIHFYNPSSATDAIAVDFKDCDNLRVQSLYVQVSPQLGYNSGNLAGVRFHSSYGCVHHITTSNFQGPCLWVTANPVGTGANPGLLNFFGGLVDETTNGSVSLRLSANGNANAFGLQVWGGGGDSAYAAHIDGTSTLRLDACELGPFVALSKNCMLIDTGGEVRAGKSTFRGAGSSPVCVTNNGKFIDCDGNEFLNGATGTYVPVSWRSALSRPSDITRNQTQVASL
jgi:hypothetical protein